VGCDRGEHVVISGALSSVRRAERRSGWWHNHTGRVTFGTALALMIAQTSVFETEDTVFHWKWAGYFLCAGLAFIRLGTPRLLRPARSADLFALAFVAYALVSAMYSPYPTVTIGRAISVGLLYISVFWLLWSDATRGAEPYIVGALIDASSVIFLLSLLAIPVAPALAFQTDGRFRGIMINPNSIGLLGAVMAPLTLSRALATRRWSDFLRLLLGAACLTLCFSRTGIGAALAGVGYVIFKERATTRIARLLTVAAIVGVVAATSMWDAASELDLTIAHRLFSVGSGSGRSETWAAALELIPDAPVIGHGFGTEEYIFVGRRFQVAQGAYIHNSYLGITYQLGITGALMLFGPLLVLLYRALRRRRAPGYVRPGTAYEGVLLVGILASISESWIYSAGNAFTFPFWTSVMLLLHSTTWGPTSSARHIGGSTRPITSSSPSWPKAPAYASPSGHLSENRSKPAASLHDLPS
jgi:O-antigen ligase